MIINGIELELDLMDADVADKLQDAIETLNIDTEKTDRLGGMIRQQCETINNLFDEVFGEGASEAVFLGKMNLTTHLVAFGEVIKEIEKVPETMESLLAQYIPKVDKKPKKELQGFKKPMTKPATKKKFRSVK